MHRFFDLVITIVLVGSTAVGGAQPIRVVDYRLEVSVVPEESYMSAVAAITLSIDSASGDSLHFFLHGELSVDSLIIDGRACEFRQEKVQYPYDYSLIANRVTFYLAAMPDSSLSCYYRGYFNPSKARSPSDYMRIDSDGVFLRALGYSPWFPIFLDPGADSYAADFSEVKFRLPADFAPVFVGQRTAEEVTPGHRISRWTARAVDLFAAQFTAQRYRRTEFGNINLYHYADTASVTSVAAIATFVRNLIDRYQVVYRTDIASSQVHIMEMPRFGDISSGNTTGISAEIWTDFSANEWSKRALAHELVHPYVDTQTPRGDSLYSFVIEGFPSYFHLPILAEFFGEDWYQRRLQQTEDDYLKKRQTGRGWRDRLLPPEKPLTQIAADEVGIYKDSFLLDDRALLFIDWIRRQLGNERFYTFSRALFANASVTHDSFVQLVSEHLPGSAGDVKIWLSATAFLDRFALDRH